MTIALRPRPRQSKDALPGENASLEQRVAALETRIAALEREMPPHLRRHGDKFTYQAADDRALVDAIAKSVGVSVLFSARELVAHAAVDPALRQVLDGCTPKRLGKRLRAIASRADIEKSFGYAIDCVGRDEHGAVWQLVVTSGL